MRSDIGGKNSGMGGGVLKRKSDLELRWGLGGGVVLAYEQKLP